MSLLSPHVQERLSVSNVENVCSFPLLRKQQKGLSHPDRTVHWSCTPGSKCNGLADQLRGIARGFLLALNLGFQFHATWTYTPDYVLPRNRIEWDARARALHGKPFDCKHEDPCAWQKCTHMSTDTTAVWKRQGGLPCQCGDPMDTYVNRTRKLLRWPAEAACVFWFLFSLNQEVEAALRKRLLHFRAWKMKNGRENAPVITLYIRFGDHALRDQTSHSLKDNFGRTMHQVVSEGYQLVGKVEEETLNISKESATVLVISDSERIKQLAVEHSPSLAFASKDKPYHAAHHNGDHDAAGVLGIWMDLLMMAAASDAMVLDAPGSSGGFGRLASNLGMIPSGLVREGKFKKNRNKKTKAKQGGGAGKRKKNPQAKPAHGVGGGKQRGGVGGGKQRGGVGGGKQRGG
eukprot:3337971-Rhodomonas_salina.1